MLLSSGQKDSQTFQKAPGQAASAMSAMRLLTKSVHLKNLILPSKQATDELRKRQHLALARINSVS